MVNNVPTDVEYLSAAQVKARYGGVSDMWLHRKLASHGFPKPQTFGTAARYWRVVELAAWEAAMRDCAIKGEL
jgi:predicted DNA-binding transcriptional regulator AlpA